MFYTDTKEARMFIPEILVALYIVTETAFVFLESGLKNLELAVMFPLAVVVCIYNMNNCEDERTKLVTEKASAYICSSFSVIVFSMAALFVLVEAHVRRIYFLVMTLRVFEFIFVMLALVACYYGFRWRKIQLYYCRRKKNKRN